MLGRRKAKLKTRRNISLIRFRLLGKRDSGNELAFSLFVLIIFKFKKSSLLSLFVYIILKLKSVTCSLLT